MMLITFFCFHERYWTASSYFPSSVLVKSLYCGHCGHMYDVVMQRLDNWTSLTNAAIGPSPAQRRAATSENPTACTPYVRNIPQLDAPPMKYRTPTY